MEKVSHLKPRLINHLIKCGRTSNSTDMIKQLKSKVLIPPPTVSSAPAHRRNRFDRFV